MEGKPFLQPRVKEIPPTFASNTIASRSEIPNELQREDLNSYLKSIGIKQQKGHDEDMAVILGETGHLDETQIMREDKDNQERE